MLEVKNLNTGYGNKQVLFNVSIEVEQGSIVCLIGPNGSGKSTMLKSISGVLKPWDGEIIFNGKTINRNSTSKNISLGLTYSPQGNRVFNDLSVFENLEIGGFLLSKQKQKERIENVLEIFPALKAKLKQEAGTLSGGEQQMLALARALVPEPKLLLLDEPSLGLAPNLLNDVFEKLTEINKNFDLTMLIVEQKVKEILAVANKVYSLKLGKIAFEGKPTDLKNNSEKLKELFL